MESFIYAVFSITSMHCAVRPEISPCTCEPIYAHNYVELSCEKVDSFHQIVDALSNKFEPNENISLKISHSQLDDLEMRSFTDMNLNVVKLRMQWNGLRSVPELPFRGLSKVEFLSIGDNELEEIPKHMLIHMPIIKTLDMGRCRIRSVLQDDFRGIQMMNSLFLVSNNITRLDKGAFPPGLVILHLGRNQIERLNGTLHDLNLLESLFINMNSISNLDNELPESNRLKLIMAQNNRLERMPESMRYMTKLETLHFQHNRLKSFDTILKNAKNLNEFLAYNNEIEFLAQEEFQDCQDLGELNLAFNHIRSLNHSLLPLTDLCSANFSYNDIDEFSINEIRGLRHLKQLDLSHNRIQKLSGRQGNNIDQDTFLIEFNMDHNQLKSLDGALMGLNSLRILSLSNNQIERLLPEDFIGLVELELLDLSHNQLLTLKEMQATFLPHLKILKVAYNNLTKLEKDFHGLPVLCQANLTNNQISSISPELVSKTRCMNHNVAGKLELHLEDNPIMCDERLNELCPIMLAQETRIRGKSQCFENDQEVCIVLPMLFIYQKNENLPILVQQDILPSNAKPMLQVIVPASALLGKQRKKSDELLPPLIAPLGQPLIKPLIITPTMLATTIKTSTTTTTTTTTPAPKVPETISKSINETIYTEPDVTTPTTTAATLITTTAVPNTTVINEATTPTTITAPTTSTTTTTKTTTTSTVKPDISTPETPPLVLDIKQTPVVAQNLNQAMVSITDGAIAPPAPQTEYATVEYIPNLDEFMPGNHPPDVLDEESNSNSVHEEFPSVVLANLDNAPQSLLIPEEPPENP